MLGLLENANKVCLADTARAEFTQTQTQATSSTSSSLAAPLREAPALESMLVYSKFRGLGFRMRELGYLLRCSELQEEARRGLEVAAVLGSGGGAGAGSVGGRSAFSSDDFAHHFGSRGSGSGSAGDASASSGAGHEVLATYRQIRCELLGPVIRGTSLKSQIDQILLAAQKGARVTGTGSAAAAAAAAGGEVSPQVLCAVVRAAFATIFHVAQLEQQLYTTLFHTTTAGKAEGGSVISAHDVLCCDPM
jgi:hypothetical protein